MKTYLGIEFGSTRIKATQISEDFSTLSSGDYTWKSEFKDGVWTYDLAEVWTGLKAALSKPEGRDSVACAGISGMMHGYLAFDENWQLLTPFRTWQNTMTAEAAETLTELFGFNIPQRWSIAHLYQAVLNKEAHLERLAHITTLAGYVHFMLTGDNVVGIGEASGMFPIDSLTFDYDSAMLEKFDALKVLKYPLKKYLPKVLRAGEAAGALTEGGAKLIDDLLPVGTPFAPPEGDAATGMTATNAVAPRTGNISAGTSIFSMVVMEKPLSKVHPEIDIVATPEGRPVAMVHCNNCTNDMNVWAGVLDETARLFGTEPDTAELYTKLYQKSLEGEPDCGGIITCNYMAGEGVTHFNEGRPFVLRRPDSHFTLANFLRSQLYATMATLKIGMDILAQEEVAIESLTGHGGLFKTPVVGQKYMAAACNAPVTVMETAGEGGSYGMALLAAYMDAIKDANNDAESLGTFLSNKVFKDAAGTTLLPEAADVEGFNRYICNFISALKVEAAAVNQI